MSEKARRRMVLATFAGSGAAALIYEVAWTRELSVVFGSTVYAVSTMLASFMAGLALGGWLGGRWADRAATPVSILARIEFGIGAFGLLTIPAIRLLPAIYFTLYRNMTPGLAGFVALQVVLGLLVMIVPTTLMGAGFPVISRFLVRSRASLGTDVGTAYSINTLGSLVGSASAGFLLIPAIGVRGAVIFAASLNVLAAVVLVLLSSGRRRGLNLGSMVLVVIAIVGFGQLIPDPTLAMGFNHLNRYDSLAEYFARARQVRTVFSDDGPYSRVEVFRDVDGTLLLQNGGLIEGSSGAIDRPLTHLLAYLPSAFQESRSRGLVVGLGTGYTSRAMLDAGYDEIVTVEVNPSVATASRYFVGNDLVDDPRSVIVVDDARNYLARGGDDFDVVVSEPSWPLSDSVSHLFTREFFIEVEERLASDGVYCQWIPRYLFEREDFMLIYHTFADVFPNNQVWGMDAQDISSSELLMIGFAGETVRSPEEAHQMAAELLAARGIGGVSFHPFESTETLKEALSDPSISLNTDDRPILEFRLAQHIARRFSAPIQ